MAIQISRNAWWRAINDPPEDFLPFSCAINRLADGMWGSLPRPNPVAAIKQSEEIITWVWPLAGEGRTAPQGRGRKREIGDLRIRQASSSIRRSQPYGMLS